MYVCLYMCKTLGRQTWGQRLSWHAHRASLLSEPAPVCCSVLQRVTGCCSVLQNVAECCSVLQCVAVYCSVLQCVAVCCSVWQCVAIHNTNYKIQNKRMHIRIFKIKGCMFQILWMYTIKIRNYKIQNNNVHIRRLRPSATHCNTLEHTRTHCNTLQHTAY